MPGTLAEPFAIPGATPGTPLKKGDAPSSDAPSSPRSIRLLPPEIVHRIAAGEIVDRPASVVKELVENSLDAGSTRIRITLVEGGVKEIQVEDNGWGLSKGDLEVCLQRHATSKITSLNDLESIFTLGFRGEALSAVSSVSRLTIETFREGENAWCLEVLGGQRKDLRPSHRASGTRVRVEDLFFNIPARKKFLKRAATEARECVEVLEGLALSHPQIAFEWFVVDTAGQVKAQRQLEPTDAAQRFVELCLAPRRSRDPETGEVEALIVQKSLPDLGISQLQIVALKPPAASPHQKSVRLSVNGRFIFDKRLPFATREAYAGLIEVGAYPFVHIAVQVDPSIIDVNIHPQKKEIRWPAGFSLAGVVYSALRPSFQVSPASAPAGLESSALHEPHFSFAAPPVSATALSTSTATSVSAYDDVGPSFNAHASAASPTALPAFLDNALAWIPNNAAGRSAPALSSVSIGPGASRPPFEFRELRVVGEVGAAWIICESPQGLVLIDQHAAHERVNFERILRQKELLRTKPLLVPLTLRLPLGVERDDTLVDALHALGFEAGDHHLLPADQIELVAVPDTDRKIDWSRQLDLLFHDLAHGDGPRDLATEIRVRLASSLACHGSVRRGQRLDPQSIAELLVSMSQVEWGGFCPHGRPLWYLLPHTQIEELFHR